MKLDGYVGRIVYLNQDRFQPIARRAQRQGMNVENRFIVASIDGDIGKLICYGNDFRVAVSAAEVALL